MGRSRRRGFPMITGINVTPLTDIALTLLLIFMVATPLLIQSGLKVTLPRTATADAGAEKTIMISIDKAGSVYLEKDQVQIADLKARLLSVVGARPNSPVIIMGDKDVKYDTVVRVLETVKSAGVSRVSLGVEVKK